MKTIALKNGDLVLVDDDVYAELALFKWRKDGTGYISREYRKDGKTEFELIHRRIMRLQRGDKQEVDHINGNKLDNRSENLRVCTRAQNQRNVGMIKSNTSGFKGVCRFGNKWKAQIQINRKQIYLGIFETAEAASEAYKSAAEEYFGEFAHGAAA